MARKPRIEFEGAFYHVISRGNQRQEIFRSEADFRHYTGLLARYKSRYDFRLYAYVLMGNHVHLLIERGPFPLSKVLQGITQTYTQYFNRKYGTPGHLFQGRYRAILCDRDEYLLTLLKYIHCNPLRAKAVKNLDDYPWSSHASYRNAPEDVGLVDTSLVLRMFASGRRAARNRYLAFMHDRPAADKSAIYRTVDQRLLGDEDFVAEIKNRSSGDIKEEKRRHRHSLNILSAAIEAAAGATLEQMRSMSKSRDVVSGRRIFTRTALAHGHRNKEIAAFLRKDPASITQYRSRGDYPEELERKVLADLKRRFQQSAEVSQP